MAAPDHTSHIIWVQFIAFNKSFVLKSTRQQIPRGPLGLTLLIDTGDLRDGRSRVPGTAWLYRRTSAGIVKNERSPEIPKPDGGNLQPSHVELKALNNKNLVSLSGPGRRPTPCSQDHAPSQELRGDLLIHYRHHHHHHHHHISRHSSC